MLSILKGLKITLKDITQYRTHADQALIVNDENCFSSAFAPAATAKKRNVFPAVRKSLTLFR